MSELSEVYFIGTSSRLIHPIRRFESFITKVQTIVIEVKNIKIKPKLKYYTSSFER